MGGFEKAMWPRQIIWAAAMGVSAIVMGFGSPLLVVLGYPLVDVVSSPWGIAGFLGYIPHLLWGLFSVAGVLFGAWGVLAVCVSATVSNLSSFPSNIAALQSVSTLLVALIPAWAFRHFKGDPRLRTARDGVLFMVFAVILANLTSTLIAHTLLYIYRVIPNLEALFYTTQWWFLKTSISTLIFGFPVQMLISRIVIKARAYCKGWFF